MRLLRIVDECSYSADERGIGELELFELCNNISTQLTRQLHNSRSTLVAKSRTIVRSLRKETCA